MHRFQAGDRAKLSTPTKPDYHGQLCIFVRVRDRPGDPPDGRYLLQLKNGKQVAMKPGNVIPVEPVRAAVATEVHPHAAHRRWWPCDTTHHQSHCNARPRSDACTDRFAEVVTREAILHR
jgi:hypothetical protein